MSYPSDVSDGEWALLEPFTRYEGYCRPRIHDIRQVVHGIFYVIRSGCQWRMLPNDFPPWKTVYDYYWRWRRNGTWDRMHDALREAVRNQEGRSPAPSAAIIDSRSVKTAQKGGSGAMTEAN